MKNPVGILVTVIVALVVATAFLPQIITLAAITILVAIAIKLVMVVIKPKKPAAAFCGNCGHPNHNGRRCYSCNCHTA